MAGVAVVFFSNECTIVRSLNSFWLSMSTIVVSHSWKLCSSATRKWWIFWFLQQQLPPIESVTSMAIWYTLSLHRNYIYSGMHLHLLQKILFFFGHFACLADILQAQKQTFSVSSDHNVMCNPDHCRYISSMPLPEHQ